MARKDRFTAFQHDHPLYYKISRWILDVLIVVILVSLGGGVVKTLLDLQILLKESVEVALRQTLINVLTVLAVIEVLRTAFSYLMEGRVRVTFIIDTVLIVMLNEIISAWFKGANITSLIILIAIILALVASRIFTIRYSPDNLE